MHDSLQCKYYQIFSLKLTQGLDEHYNIIWYVKVHLDVGDAAEEPVKKEEDDFFSTENFEA